MPRSDVLDPREQRFVELYVENPNGTNAILAAGWDITRASAGVYATKLLKKGRIQRAIDAAQAKFMQRYEATPGRLIAEFSKIAFANTDDFISIQPDGSVSIDFGTATRAQLAALASIETDEEIKLGDGDEPQAYKVRKTKFKHYDKLKALTELAKLARMYPAERTELTGADGGPIATANLNVHKVDIASLEPEQRDQLRQVLLALKAKSEEPNDC